MYSSMKSLLLNYILLLVFLCSSCQNTRVISVLPKTAFNTNSRPTKLITVAPIQNHVLAKGTTLSPKSVKSNYTVDLSEAKLVVNTGFALPKKPLQQIGTPSVYQVVLPDTSTRQSSVGPTLQQIRNADIMNRALRVIGILFLIIGVALITTAFSIGSSGLGPFIALVYGVITILFSIPFLLFKSRYSTRRLSLEKRRAARRAAK